MRALWIRPCLIQAAVVKVRRIAGNFSTVDLKLHLPNENIRLAAHYTMFTSDESSGGAFFYFPGTAVRGCRDLVYRY